MKVHQNIVIDGVDYGDKGRRRYSKFCNEGKWTNFIEPHIPNEDEMTFVDMGCNAGMFLKLAKSKFKRVFGLEADTEAYNMALKYVDCDILNKKLDENFDYDSIPVADVTLLANFHYHIFMPVFLHYINLIRRKTRYLIVVSARIKTRKHFPDTDLGSVREYFKLWEEVGAIDNVSTEGDPHPRDMFSVAFKTDLQRVPIKEIEDKMGRNGTIHYRKAKQTVGDGFPYTSPLLLLKQGRIIDGSHRLAALKRDGYKSAIVEYV